MAVLDFRPEWRATRKTQKIPAIFNSNPNLVAQERAKISSASRKKSYFLLLAGLVMLSGFVGLYGEVLATTIFQH